MFVAIDNGAGAGGEILADAKTRAVGLSRQAVVGAQILDKIAQATDQTLASSFKRFLDRSRITCQRVGWGKQGIDMVHGQLGLLVT